MSSTEQVILVDKNDQEIGQEEKLAAHQKGLLHRAFSVFVFNRSGELMLQRRADGKYHSAGLWSNTCCSHPRSGETSQEAATRRLREEMGFDCPLDEAFSFIYRVSFDNNLIENEFDHVFVGSYNGSPTPDPDEVSEWRWVTLDTLEQEIAESPEAYTHWLKLCLEKYDLAGYVPSPNGH